MQFVKMYEPFNKGKKDDDDLDDEYDDAQDDELIESLEKFGEAAKFHHVIEKTGKLGKKLPSTIALVNPLPGEPKFLRKRKNPKAIRFFKVRAENNPARFFLQELMFYTCFDEETYKRWHDDDQCCAEYLKKTE